MGHAFKWCTYTLLGDTQRYVRLETAISKSIVRTFVSFLSFVFQSRQPRLLPPEEREEEKLLVRREVEGKGEEEVMGRREDIWELGRRKREGWEGELVERMMASCGWSV
jgi:hypothetical protein